MRAFLSLGIAPRLVSCWMATRSVSKHASPYRTSVAHGLMAHIPRGLMIPSESENALESARQCNEIIDVRLALIRIQTTVVL